VYIDAGFFTISEQKKDELKQFCNDRKMNLQIIEQHHIADLVNSERNRFPACFSCSRLRRKALLETGQSIGANYIALGHNKDDLMETLFLNILFSRRISAMIPKQDLFDGLFYIIRPMILVDEDYTHRYAENRVFPMVNKECQYAGKTKREWIKQLISKMEQENPGIRKNIVRSLFHPKPDYLWGRYESIADKLLK